MEAQYDLTDQMDREDRRKHLDLLQAAIARMARGSAMTKGWAITVASTAVGAGILRAAWQFDLLAAGVVLAFAHLDVLYLDSERRLRDTHDRLVLNEVAPFTMLLPHASGRDRRAGKWRAWASWSIYGFYGPMLVVVVVLVIVTAMHHSK